MLLHLSNFRFTFCSLPFRVKNMKELCFCRDRKYCSVIQHNISLFKQHFPFFLASQRQQTEYALDYNAARRCKTDSKENKIWNFYVSSQIDVYRVCTNKYIWSSLLLMRGEDRQLFKKIFKVMMEPTNILTFSPQRNLKFINLNDKSYELNAIPSPEQIAKLSYFCLITNSWEIAEDVKLFPSFARIDSLLFLTQTRLLPKWANESEMFVFRRRNIRALRHYTLSLQRLFLSLLGEETRKSFRSWWNMRLRGETNKIRIKTRWDSLKHEKRLWCLLRFVNSLLNWNAINLKLKQ